MNKQKQNVMNPDGSVTTIEVVEVMTLEEMRQAGEAKLSDPNFVAEKIEQAKKKAE